MMLYRIQVMVDADDPQGVKELLGMECERIGKARITRIDAMEEQAEMPEVEPFARADVAMRKAGIYI